MALMIFGGICNVIGVTMVMGAGHFRLRERLQWLRRDNGKQPEFNGSWSIGFGGFLIIIGSALMTLAYVNDFA